MSAGGRGRSRQRILRRLGVIVGVLVLLTLVFLISGHWVLAVILGAAAAVAIWVLVQARAVR